MPLALKGVRYRPLAVAAVLRRSLLVYGLGGVVAPFVGIKLIAQGLFRDRAEGSFVADGAGKVVGPELVAQAFTGAGYFQPRPSAAGEKGYDPLGSGGSNLGPTSKKLRDRAAAAVEQLRRANPDASGPVPAELVTASGSGLDPHLSPAAAAWQAARVARARRGARSRARARGRAHRGAHARRPR